MAPKIFARLKWRDQIYYAIREGEAYRAITAAPYESWQPTAIQFPAKEATHLSPVLPSKIIAVGLNYRSHALEMGMALPQEPLLFLKPPTALADPGQDIVWPLSAGRVDFEGELAMVIGRIAKNINPQEAMDYVLGYTLANDITARDLQKKDGQWARAKGFDGFCPLGPVLVTEIDWAQFELTTRLQNATKQNGKIEDLIFSLPEIVAFASQVMTLHPGDVILTGTPPGIGPWPAGETVCIAENQIGRLENKLIGGPQGSR